MCITSFHSALTLVQSSGDPLVALVWDKWFQIVGVDRTRILIRVYAAHAGHVAVQYVLNPGKRDRRCRAREFRQMIFSETRKSASDLELACLALNSFVDKFIGADEFDLAR